MQTCTDAAQRYKSSLPYVLLIVVALIVGNFITLKLVFADLSPAEIVQKVDEVRSPQQDYTVVVEVASFTAVRQNKSATYEVMVKGKDSTVIKTVLPQNERGRVLLMREDDLWAFFPEVTKPLRLSLQERLLGEVANGDIARVNFSGDYDAKILRSEKLEEKDCYVLELTANRPGVTYGKAILWAEKDTFWPVRAEFYAVSGRLLKRCSYEAYDMLAERLRPTRLVMEDPLTQGKKSVITYTSIKVEELPEKYFTKDYMKKLME